MRRGKKREEPAIPWLKGAKVADTLAELNWRYAERVRMAKEAGDLLEELGSITSKLQVNWALNSENEDEFAQMRKVLDEINWAICPENKEQIAEMRRRLKRRGGAR